MDKRNEILSKLDAIEISPEDHAVLVNMIAEFEVLIYERGQSVGRDNLIVEVGNFLENSRK